MVKQVNNNNGITALELLQVVLIVLKILGYIKWSWWLVFAPSITVAVVVILFIIAISLI